MQTHKILNIASPNIPLQDSLHKELGISKILAQLLINRSIQCAHEADKFLNPKIENLLDPYSFSDMHKAVELVRRAQKNKERVMVFGDYDVDGLTALTLVKEVLQKRGIDTVHYLPHRIKEGYGLTKNILHIAGKNNIKLLITVDCGIGNHKEVEELRGHGIDVVITDHHEPATRDLPYASSIINPKTKDSNYKFRDLAGVGVAYKFCKAIAGSTLSDELDLVALGTIADSVPLVGENRIIAKEGLLRLTKTKRPGIRALIESAGIENRKFTSTFVAFILAPRINASGRMDSADVSLDLLMSRTKEEAEKLAKVLEVHNRARQKVESKILDEAEAIINREINFKEHKVIVIAKEDWHKGVLGIVASKLADRFYRPAIVISVDEKLCKGSARSIKNFHLFDALKDCREFLNAFGGHSHAAGIVITKDNIDDFRQNINRLANERLSLEDLLPSLDIDMEVMLSDLNDKIIFELEKLEPFGSGNPEPLFYTKHLKLKGQPQVLGRETLKFWITDGFATCQAIGFGMSSLKDNFNHSAHFDLVYTPRVDSWAGEDSTILEIKDIFFK